MTEECSSSFLLTEIPQFCAALRTVMLCALGAFPGQAAAAPLKTEPQQQCRLLGDTEQMLHCRALMGAMGEGELMTFFICVPCAPLALPRCPLSRSPGADEMLFLAQCPTSAYLSALVHSPPWLLLPAWPLSLSMLNSARPCAVRESMEGIKGH